MYVVEAGGVVWSGSGSFLLCAIPGGRRHIGVDRAAANPAAESIMSTHAPARNAIVRFMKAIAAPAWAGLCFGPRLRQHRRRLHSKNTNSITPCPARTIR